MAKKPLKLCIKSQTILKTPFTLLLCNHSFFSFPTPDNILVQTITAAKQRKGIPRVSALAPGSRSRSTSCQRGDLLEGDPEQDTRVERRAIFASRQVPPYLLSTIPRALTRDTTGVGHPPSPTQWRL